MILDTKTIQNKLLSTKTVTLHSSNLNIRYAELGDDSKPSIILLHGVPENLQAWYAVAPLLQETFHVFAIDWPGFGGSELMKSLNDYTSLRFSEVVVDFMNTMQITEATLMSTDIALLPSFLVGLHDPEKVSQIIAMDGIPFPRPQYSSWELKSFGRKGSLRAKALVEWFPKISAEIAYSKGFYGKHNIPLEIRQEFLKDSRTKANQKAFLHYFQNFKEGQEYFELNAQNMNVPVQLVWGKHDRFISVKLAYEIVDKLPNAQLKVIENSGHYVHMNTPVELVKLTNEFYKKQKTILRNHGS